MSATALKPGRFISVEGVEGVGKSTNLRFIEAFLRERQIDLITTREPGGTPLAEELRNLLLREREEPVDAQAELLMVFAARAQHLQQVILPALNRGQWVLCDRFTDATYAYQGAGRGLSAELIEQLENIVQRGRQPDVTVFFDLDVETGLQRAKLRGEADRFEGESLAFFERVRAGYWQRIKRARERFMVIDASGDLPAVQARLAAALEKLLAAPS